MEAVAAICSLVSTSLAVVEQLGGDGLDGLLDAALERHRVGAGGDVAQALAHQRLGEHGGGGRAVTGDVVGLLGDLLDELGADLLVRVLELDLLGDGDTVVGDRGGAPLLLEHDVAALRAEGHLDGVGEMFMPRSRPRRASSSNAMILAIRVVPPGREWSGGPGGARDGRPGSARLMSPRAAGPHSDRSMFVTLMTRVLTPLLALSAESANDPACRRPPVRHAASPSRHRLPPVQGPPAVSLCGGSTRRSERGGVTAQGARRAPSASDDDRVVEVGDEDRARPAGRVAVELAAAPCARRRGSGARRSVHASAGARDSTAASSWARARQRGRRPVVAEHLGEHHGGQAVRPARAVDVRRTPAPATTTPS